MERVHKAGDHRATWYAVADVRSQRGERLLQPSLRGFVLDVDERLKGDRCIHVGGVRIQRRGEELRGRAVLH
eukprot:4860261-Prymnesium_polylepis.3